MLSSLIKRLNRDENAKIQDGIITESSQFNENDYGLIDQISQGELDILKEAISSTNLSDEDSAYECVNKLKKSIINPIGAIQESVVSTSKQVIMTKEDYITLIDMVKNYNKAEDTDKKLYIKKFKDFVRKVSSELRKCNDENPADALITALTNKLCKLFDVEIKEDDISAKYKLVAKLNALAKKLSKI